MISHRGSRPSFEFGPPGDAANIERPDLQKNITRPFHSSTGSVLQAYGWAMLVARPGNQKIGVTLTAAITDASHTIDACGRQQFRPVLGQNTDSIMIDEPGLTRERIQSLCSDGAL